MIVLLSTGNGRWTTLPRSLRRKLIVSLPGVSSAMNLKVPYKTNPLPHVSNMPQSPCFPVRHQVSLCCLAGSFSCRMLGESLTLISLPHFRRQRATLEAARCSVPRYLTRTTPIPHPRGCVF
ncbi:hypothetical protein KIL84_002391 [Mauremys mutica]|uniref:Uncharacterized protein n=1 Tax=Mauremys mutica TaxID=74926 RepID=A0A9D3X665_9SAUR|nr:hypothetical protein KIL84_002391 [Mauremys mutica]